MVNHRLGACLLALGSLTACGGGGSGSAATPSTSTPGTSPTPTASRFDPIDSAMAAAYAAQAVPIGISIYDANGVKVHERMFGNFSADQRVAVASASKMVAGVVILRLVDQGWLSLDSTTAEVLGWNGAGASINLRQLLSFTSGLRPAHPCTSNATTTLAACVDEISREPVIAQPAVRFDYGSTHLHVAARMAEVATGSTWNAIFAQQLRDAVGISPTALYYTFPRQAIGTTNPLVAGGLRMSMNEYARVLGLIFNKGQWQGATLVSAGLFEQQSRQPYPAVVIGISPAEQGGFNYKYGLTAWLECTTPAAGCARFSSPGAFGFTPWIDRAAGYYAILGMETTSTQDEIVNWALTLEQQLQPLIAQAVAN